MTTPEEIKRGNLPPYISFKTLTGFIQKLKETSVPGRVDGGVLRNYAGSVARQLTLALKYLKLTDQAGTPSLSLTKLVASYGTPQWEGQLQEVLEQSFNLVVGNLDLDNGTYQQLAEAFRATGAEGVVLERAINFYLSGLKAAGLSYSPHFASRPRRPKQAKVRLKKKDEGVDAEGEEDQDELFDPTGSAKFSFPIPGKTAARIVLPVDISTDDWEMINTMMRAYVARLEKSSQ